MRKFFLLFILLNISALNASNFLEFSLQQTKQTHHDLLFKELVENNETKSDSYENFSKSINNSYININSNFNDLLGFNYSMAAKGIDYKSYEFYVGTNYLKYFAIKNISSSIDFSTNVLNKDIKEYTFIGFITYSKQSMRSNKIESIEDKRSNLETDTQALLPTSSDINIHRDYELEKFKISTEYLYEIAKDDNIKNNQYILPIMISKKITNNFGIYGTIIIGYVQENYTAIDSYFIDNNNTKHNITYSTENNTDSNTVVVSKSIKDPIDDPHFVAQYRGYEYGFKITAEYKLKYISIFTTAYQKYTVLKNKHKLTDKQEYIASDANNVVIYDKIRYEEKYLSFGLSYRF